MLGNDAGAGAAGPGLEVLRRSSGEGSRCVGIKVLSIMSAGSVLAACGPRGAWRSWLLDMMSSVVMAMMNGTRGRWESRCATSRLVTITLAEMEKGKKTEGAGAEGPAANVMGGCRSAAPKWRYQPAATAAVLAPADRASKRAHFIWLPARGVVAAQSSRPFLVAIL